MAHQRRRLNEWDINGILDALFMARYLDEYMMIFKDGDLHAYADHMRKELDVKSRRDTDCPLNPQTFRPDAVVLDREGQASILETKIGSGVSSEADHLTLVIQALVYSSRFISPAWEGGRGWKTYQFLDYLHRAYWHNHRKSFSGVVELKEEHKLHFELASPLKENDFRATPSIIFLLESFNDQKLRAAIDAVRRSDFDTFQALADNHMNKGSQFRKRLTELRENWRTLQTLKFFTMSVDHAKLKSIIGDRHEVV